MVTHLHGLACPIEEIAAICRSKEIPLVEDVAQALGARVNGRALGTFGDAGMFSFGMAKNVNSFYGGMVVTDDEHLYQTVREQIRALPYQELSVLLRRAMRCLIGDVVTHPLVFSVFGFWLFRYGYLHNIKLINQQLHGEYNPEVYSSIPEHYLRRMTPMQARLVNEQLDLVEEHSQKRIENARLYHEGLSDIPDILLPPMREDGSHIYLTYPIQMSERHALISFLMKNGRDVVEQHFRNNADRKWFAQYFRNCPNARLAADQVLLLPTYPRYNASQIKENIRLINDFPAS
jgi:dTDP-4-amino-4,6-dideoxygalactose transaminase